MGCGITRMNRSGHIAAAILIMLGIAGPAGAQGPSTASVDRVRMSLKNGRVYVTYELVDEDPTGKHHIDLKFISDRHELISPRSTTGDIGPGISPGPDKVIVWNIGADLPVIKGKISPLVVLDHNLYNKKHGGGPESAWYSLLMPGLGDYKVADPREMKLPPYLRTGLSWGFIGLGIAAAVIRDQEEGRYETYIPDYGWYPQDLGYDPTLKKRFVEGPTRYWLFRGDAEVFIAAGLMVWIYDILWVSSRGKSNQLLMKSIENQQLSLVPLPGGMGLSYRFNF